MAILEKAELVANAVGRMVPESVNGRTQVPYMGAGKYRPLDGKAAPAIRTSADYPTNGDKRVPDLETALRKCGLRDGMVVSSHHHLRDGDRVALMALEAAARISVKNLMWFPSASFPSQKTAIELMESGVIDHIEGSMNGPLGDYCTQGKMHGMGVLRSHGGRWQAIQDGEVHIDIAVIAAPTADAFGNCDGSHGNSACGSLGFALADSIYADHVIVVTDNLVPFPCVPWQIQGNNVDYVVEVDCIGDPSRIVSGTTQITRSPDRLRIAEFVARFLRDAGIMRNGFSFQAGAGGIALAFVGYLKQMMKQADVKARFVRGGSPHDLGEFRAWRLDQVPGRVAGRRTHRLHPRWANLRPRRSALHGEQPASCSDFSIHFLQLPRQREFRVDGRRGCARRDRGGHELQRQCGHALRRTTSSWHWRMAELPCGAMHDPGCAFLPRPHSGDRRRGDDALRARRIDRCGRDRTRHCHQPAASGSSGCGQRIEASDPSAAGNQRRSGTYLRRKTATTEARQSSRGDRQVG